MISSEDFPAFYAALHNGQEPFLWQTRLAMEVAQQGWPDRISLPTGSGKTAVIDIAVFALALQGGSPGPHRRTRIYFVVDRRLVVDEAAQRARLLADALSQALERGDSGILGLVARTLMTFGGYLPLEVAVMRGGIYFERQWVRYPNQPAVCLTTVDQIGSRLLFRGYGVSKGQRPIQAALAANDALYIIDEAHLSTAFVETLHSVRFYQGLTGKKVGTGLKVVTMSATLTSKGTPLAPDAGPNVPAGERQFTLAPEDYTDPKLAPRLNARKPATLINVKDDEDFISRVVAQAVALGQENPVVGVVLNDVSAARAVAQKLKGVGQRQVVLLTGRVRPYDRDRLLGEWLPFIAANRERGHAQKEVYVVATQTIEVGADLDFDALVTEAAPLKSLVQRFGRLNRLGIRASAPAAILYQKARAKRSVYSEKAVEKCWKWLNAHAIGKGSRKQFDFGITASANLLANANDADEAQDESSAPLLLPAHLDQWVQTNPEAYPDPDVAPFLHGKGVNASADVLVVWRRDLLEDDLNDVEFVTELLSLAPPRIREAVPVPVWAVKAWLSGRVEQAREVPDDEAAGGRQAEETNTGRRAVRWLGPRETMEVMPGEIRPGDTVVVPASYGGADEYGWFPESQAHVWDVADICDSERADRLRLSTCLLNQIISPSCAPEERSEIEKELSSILFLLADDDKDDRIVGEKISLLLERLARVVGAEYAAIVSALREDGYRVRPYPMRGNELVPRGLILYSARKSHARQGRSVEIDAMAELMDDSEGDNFPVLHKVTLRRHSLDVARWAKRFSSAVGLSPELTRALRIAALAHDWGKNEPRLQVAFHGGSILAGNAPVLAKSGLDFATWKVSCKLAGCPEGYRHEFVSARLLKDGQLCLLTPEEQELVIYLAGTHHGYGRSLPPVIEDSNPQPVRVKLGSVQLQTTSAHGWERFDSGWVELFWTLVRRYGWWGIAYLETILRLADYAASNEEAREGRTDE